MRLRAAGVALILLVAGCSDEPSSSGTPSSSAPSTAPTTSAASTPPATPSPSGPSSTPTPGDCVGRVLGAMSTREKAAQLVMTGIRASGMSGSQRRTLARERPGGILLLGASGSVATTKRGIAAAVAAAGRPDGVGPLVAADQEGGQVQRLKGSGFERMPPATVQAGWSDSTLTSRAHRWGDQLDAVGVDLNLAPVADVVPASVGDSNQPIGALDRGYGSDPAQAGRHVAAFIRGMHEANVATAIKHFPGLGRVRGNTDFSSGVVDRTTRRDDPLLGSFKAGIAAGTDLVMVATATYPRIDADNRAVFSSTVIKGMLRGDLGFTGVVIADDLGTAAEVRSVPPGQRATRFVAAGGDIVITADASLTGTMIDALVAKAEQNKAFGLDDHVRRVLTLKRRQGTVTCR